MIPHLSNLPEALFAKAVGGFTGAGIVSVASLATTSITEIGPIPRWVIEGGSFLILIWCLAYAVKNLWEANKALQKDIRTTLEAQNKALAKELSDAQKSRERMETIVQDSLKNK